VGFLDEGSNGFMPLFLLSFFYFLFALGAQEISESSTSITVEDYALFLNAVAAQGDGHHLYNEKMEAGCSCSSILKIVVDSQWKYQLIEHQKALLEDSISWLDAARYCNWLENRSSMATDDLNLKRDPLLITELGVYELEGETLISLNKKATYVIQAEESVDRELHCNRLHFLVKNQIYHDGLHEQATPVEATMSGLEEVEIFFEDAAVLETLFLGAARGVNKAIEANHSCVTPPRASIRKGNASRTIKIPPIRKNLTRNHRDVIENPTYTGEEQGLKKAIATLFELKEGSLEKDNDHVSRAILLSQQALDAKEKVKIFESTRDSALEKAFPQLVAAKERAQQAEADAREACQQYLKEVQKIETKPQNSNIKTQLKKSAQAYKQLADKKENENNRVLENKKDEYLKSSDLHAVAPEWIQDEIYGSINNASLKLVKNTQKRADEILNKARKQVAQARELDCGLDAQNQIATQVCQELREKKGSLHQKIKEGEESDFCEVSFVEPNFSHKLYDSKKEFIGIPKSAEEAYQVFSLVLEEGLGAWKEVSAAADAAKHAWVEATKGIENSKKKKRIWAEGVLALAKSSTGNYSLGKSTEKEAMALGTIFVGERATSSSKFYYGRKVITLISNDGTRRFRSTSWKPDYQNYQANFERGSFIGNDSNYKAPHDGHLVITDVTRAPSKK
jgi:hypothetical protein